MLTAATNPAPHLQTLRRGHQPRAAPHCTPRREQNLYPKPVFPQDAPSGNVVKAQKLLTTPTNPAPRFSIRAKILF
ncbi:hypothetical protein [Corynebacterium diphtheriae]|uniref:hypothetical protein n=1 Tax=Corynebacterium diphtheriae TaxID=1717 RepID=UPI0020414F33|nr:hypothetical protein [Corynebacterium diphtheriae]